MTSWRRIAGATIGVLGLGLLIYYGTWPVALATFLMIFANNLERGGEKR